MANESQGFFYKPSNIKWMLRVFYACCALLVIADFVIDRHEMHPYDSLPAFYPIFGFVACVLLVIVAKEMRKWLMRDEAYYDRYEQGDERDAD
tara:strand:+ start:68 stop:346 length:279 start_codon:yes stop_codon:yes gene_type:complete